MPSAMRESILRSSATDLLIVQPDGCGVLWGEQSSLIVSWSGDVTSQLLSDWLALFAGMLEEYGSLEAAFATELDGRSYGVIPLAGMRNGRPLVMPLTRIEPDPRLVPD